ncbi:MAG: methionine gamma-lyase family protein [Lachnospiraceae bacterium]|nr:methionine gamma-lyase family protein [Lachnospiraceae bacterium]
MHTPELEELYLRAGIDPKVLRYGNAVAEELRERFSRIDETAEYNQLKVLQAFREAKVSEACLSGTTGYGYNDIGRDTLEEVYAKTFHTEAAIVRPLIACGTHALAIALSGNLRPGDELLSISGKPYDTLEEVIGIRPSPGSLREFGITYRQVDLMPDGNFDLPAIRENIRPETALVAIQRSKGYETRRTLSVAQIREAIECVKSVRKDIICMVDNCYGEFVETTEPSDVGADMTVGSLIKNPGGGLAPSGGYICGTEKCIERASYRMTCPGLGREIGPSLTLNRSFYQGFFMAPVVTAAALKGAIFAANLYERLGFDVIPDGSESRHDIIQAITLRSPEAVSAFCRGIQKGAPVDSFVTPEPWDMPGYDDPVIMAAGAFVMGSSIELSADGPLRPPYNVYFQGGLTWPSAKAGVLMSLQSLCDAGLVHI